MSSNSALDQTGFTIEDVCFSFITNDRFYATILAKMKKQPMDPKLMPTLAVGFSKKGSLTLFFNKTLFPITTLRRGQGCLEHEVLHVFFQHLSKNRFKPMECDGSLASRIRKAHFNKIVNQGLDCAINQFLGKEKLPSHEDMRQFLGITLEEYKKGLPKEVTSMSDCMCLFPETFDLEKDRDAEFYIAELMKKFPEPPMGMCPMCGGSMNQPGQSDSDSGDGKDQSDSNDGKDQSDSDDGKGGGQKDSKDQGDNSQGGGGGCPCCGNDNPGPGQDGTLDDHSHWAKVIDPDTGEKSDIKDYDIDADFIVKDVINKSIKECKNFGNLPACVQKELERLQLPARVNWKQKLRIFLQSALQMAKRLTTKRVSRRIRDTKWIHKGKVKSRRPRVIYAKDTSGSMYRPDIQQEIANEMLAVSKRADVYCVDFDVEIQQEYKFRKITDIKPYKGGGGTCFLALFELAKKMGVDGIVIATDTYGRFPQKKDIGHLGIHTIWLTLNQETIDVPFGHHVNIEDTD